MKTADYINDNNTRYQHPDISSRYATPHSVWSSEYADLTITTKVDPPITEAPRKVKEKKKFQNPRYWLFGILFCIMTVLLIASIYLTTNMMKENISIKREIQKIHELYNTNLSSSATTVGKWYLGMNLNPADGHIMEYTTGWADGLDIGSADRAFIADYINKEVWNRSVNRIAIVRHNMGIMHAVRVWEFRTKRSMLSRFKATNPGRKIASKGGPIQEFIIPNTTNMDDDPIFSVPGDVAINWVYTDNGHRIVITGGHLSEENSNDDNTHGLGNNYHLNAERTSSKNPCCECEIAYIQNSSYRTYPVRYRAQGTDHGPLFSSGTVYGNYAIYVSEDAKTFPTYPRLLFAEVNE